MSGRGYSYVGYPYVRLAEDIHVWDWPWISASKTRSQSHLHTHIHGLSHILAVSHTNIHGLSDIQISTACLTYRYPRPLLHTDIPASSTYRYPRPYIKYIYLPSVSPYGYWFEQDYVRLAVSYNRDHTLNYRTIIYISFDIQLIFYGRIATLC